MVGGVEVRRLYFCLFVLVEVLFLSTLFPRHFQVGQVWEQHGSWNDYISAATEKETLELEGENVRVRHEARCGPLCSREIGFSGTRIRMEGLAKSLGDHESMRIWHGTKDRRVIQKVNIECLETCPSYWKHPISGIDLLLIIIIDKTFETREWYYKCIINNHSIDI